MDKKPNHSYSRQGSNKTQQSSELTRKSSDSYNTKQQWPRNTRRRENPNQPNSKLDAARIAKSQSFKNRPNVDKRPKPRNYGNNTQNVSVAAFNLPAPSTGLAVDDAASSGSGATNDELFEAELNSVYLPGSKKQNLNHLLNFHYASREHDNAGTMNIFNRISNRNTPKRHKYNKEQFLQANFQFVLRTEDNIQKNIGSPDTLVDWALIEQINIQTTEEPQCPICLYPPIAAKLTRCGHAYCWPCILHYLALSDKSWRKCPICYEAVHTTDLKSTTIVQQNNWIVGNTILLQLMRRKQGSMFIEKVGVDEYLQNIPHLKENNDMKKFTKFLLADAQEIQSIIERERKELEATDDLDSPESIFVKQALDLLIDRENKLPKTLSKDVNRNKVTIKESLENLQGTSGETEELTEVAMQQNNIDLTEKECLASSDVVDDSAINSSIDNTKYYYFYQSCDGQNIYLHALNVKLLQSMYGSLDKSPATIEGKILEKHSYSMNDDLRKKLRYLQHLPLTCQFEVVELEFKPPLISPEILAVFKNDIILRQKARMRRAREERKRERQINEINERQMGKIIAHSANIDINSAQQFPSCGFDDFPSGNSIGDFPPSLASYLSSSPPTTSKKSASGTSFAEMLSSPKREFWPTLDRTASTSSNRFSELSVWGKSVSATKAPTSNQSASRIFEDDCLEENNYDVHFLQQSLGDVIVEALQQKQTTSVAPSKKDPAGAKDASLHSGKKNKKTKKMLLFSTGMNHKGN